MYPELNLENIIQINKVYQQSGLSVRYVKNIQAEGIMI
jgi:hypothetical protein